MPSITQLVRAVRRRPVKHLVRTAQQWAFGNNVYAAARLRVVRAHDAHWPTAPRTSDPALVQLHRDGFINLGQIGIDVSALAARAESVFDARESRDPHINKVNIRHPPLFHPTVGAFLRSEQINGLIRGYLGDDATLDEVQLFRAPEASADEGISGQWHQDSVGHVLLVWVLLNDLNERSRATWYAIGSHHRQLATTRFAESRFREEDVAAGGYRITRLIGKKGDAILMDSHGMHRATFEAGATRRDVLYFGYSSYAKSFALRHPLMNNGIGIVDERFPADFDPAGTLLRRERLFKRDGYVAYEGFGARAPIESNSRMVVLDP